MSNPVDLKTVHIQEIFSFRLFYEGCTPPCSLEEGRDLWQALTPGEREVLRSAGKRFLGRLEESGLGVRTADNKEVLKTIEFLLTVPPRIAYELPLPVAEPQTPTITLPNPPRSV